MSFGAGPEMKFGHQSYQPLILGVSNATVGLSHSVLMDGRGPALGIANSRLSVEDSVVWRFVAGGELVDLEAFLARSHFAEFPDADRRRHVADSDADGLYVVGGRVEVRQCVVRDATDDGIDSGTGEGVRRCPSVFLNVMSC